MRLLRIILVLTLLVAQYSAAQAFGGVCHCPRSMTAGKMMDCCKEKTGKTACGSCMSCAMAAPAALTGPAGFSAAPLKIAPQLAHISAPAQRFLPPDFRPPDFPA